MQTATFLATAALLLLIQLHGITAIDLNTAKESCFPVNETVRVDEKFLAANKTWYYPLMSRFDLYWAGITLTGKNPEDLHENELYYDGCFTFKFDEEGNLHMSGFQNKESVIRMKPVEGSESQVYNGYTYDGKSIATLYNTLTDNKSFVVIAAWTVK